MCFYRYYEGKEKRCAETGMFSFLNEWQPVESALGELCHASVKWGWRAEGSGAEVNYSLRKVVATVKLGPFVQGRSD